MKSIKKKLINWVDEETALRKILKSLGFKDVDLHFDNQKAVIAQNILCLLTSKGFIERSNFKLRWKDEGKNT